MDLAVSQILRAFVADNEPWKQAGGSASSGLSPRKLRQNTEVRRFPVRNLENGVISQTSCKQRKFEDFFQSYGNILYGR